MTYSRIILRHFPSLKLLSVCACVLILMALTWEPDKVTPKQDLNRLSYAKTRLRRTLRKCTEYIVELEGPMSLDMEETPDLDFLAKNEFIGVKAGGKWQPESCVEPRTVAVVIPFRDVHGDRTRNLKYLVMQLHHILQRHMLKYVIIVAQQNGTEGYTNKGLLMNLGFLHFGDQYNCVVFNDVDLIPVDDHNYYGCDVDGPTHISSYVNDKIITYDQATGGVLSMPVTVFTSVNGFSNRYWGWGNEDDDMYHRITKEGYKLYRAPPENGQYLHLAHRRNYNNSGYRPPSSCSYKEDGLNSVKSLKVKLIDLYEYPLYTLLNYAFVKPDDSNMTNPSNIVNC